jgi:hypothetical protein
MATTSRPGLPYVWASWLPKLLAGETACVYQPWLKSHFKYDKRPGTTFNLAAWTREHSLLVNARAAELRDDGWTVTLEDQNAFKLHGKSAILAGKPDLIAVRADTDVALVVDGKTGQQKHADWWQVLIYMLIVPRVRAGVTRLRGEVAYADHRVPIAPEELTPAIANDVYTLLRQLGEAGHPPTTPSRKDCAWCDIADCRDRFVDREVPVLVSEF